MGKKKKLLLAICCLCLLALNVLIIRQDGGIRGTYKLHMAVNSDKEQKIQIYYSPDQQPSEAMSQTKTVKKPGEIQELDYQIPYPSRWLRLDLGNEPADYDISALSVSCGKEEVNLLKEAQLGPDQIQQISDLSMSEKGWHITTEGEDPYLWVEMSADGLEAAAVHNSEIRNLILHVLALLFLDGGALAALIFRKKIFHLPVELIQSRGLIFRLAKNDFKTKYAGSYLGIVWAFVQPVVTILVYWFVFSVGLRAGRVSDYPFVLYLVSGIVPWFFFQDALNGGTNGLLEYNYLVKKVVFKISILPMVKVISAFFVHMFFVAFSLILCACYGYFPGLATLQIIYYSGCTFLLVLGLVYATSAIVIFFRDLTQIIGIFLQVGVWLIPIMWDINMLSEYPLIVKLFKLNPMYYVVSGYRDAMLGKVWFWQHAGWTLYFWVVTCVLFLLGSVIFKRLKPHFADVL